MYFEEPDFDLRCEWGTQGTLQLAATSNGVIIVDVRSCSTYVEISASRGATVFA